MLCALLATAPAAATCLPSLDLTGEAELAALLKRRLDERHLRTDGVEAGCGSVRVDTRPHRGEDGQIVVTFTGPGGGRSERSVPTVETAAAWIETMLRGDLYADLVGPRAAPHKEPLADRTLDLVEIEGEVQQEGPGRLRRGSLLAAPLLQVGADTFAEKTGVSGGVELGACGWLGPVCVGVRGQGVWLVGEQIYAEEYTSRSDAVAATMKLASYELLASARLGFRPPVRHGDLRLGPMIGVGIQGAAWSLDSVLEETSYGDQTAGFRLTGGLALSWHPHPMVGFRLGLAAGWRASDGFAGAGKILVSPEDFTSADKTNGLTTWTLPELPVVDGRLTLGVELRP